MDNTLFESQYIFGIHEPGGEQHMLAASKPGWVLFTESIGHDPNDHSGTDYSAYSSQGLGVISRLNNGYEPAGTIPNSRYYPEFAQRCANFVAKSNGCHIWIIGNEMNFNVERPPMNTPSFASPQHGSPNEGLENHPEKSLWGGLLKAVSGGMGSAELGNKVQLDDPTSDHDSYPAPSGRDDPERFSALLRDKRFQKKNSNGLERQHLPRPPHSAGREVITPGLYVDCYSACRNAIHNVPGHEHDQVLIGAVAPWNDQTRYLENQHGDWVLYFRHILELLGPDRCDGITLHTYTHGSDPNLIFDAETMQRPFEQYHYHFKAYQDFMHAVPENMRHLPVYITETDEDEAWLDQNNGWIKNAYGNINYWNQQPNHQQIRALILYRWPKIDKWAIADKHGVIDDFRTALENEYRWRSPNEIPPLVKPTGPTRPSPLSVKPTPAPFTTGMVVAPNTTVNLRQTAGYLNKPAHDFLFQLPAQSRVFVIDSRPAHVDEIIWWQVQTLDRKGALVQGWLAQFDLDNTPLLEHQLDATQGLYQPTYDRPVQSGTRVQTVTDIYVRLTPGYQGKADSDVITVLPKGYDLTIATGPENAHGLAWWRVYDSSNPRRFLGWVADSWPDESGNFQLLIQPMESIDPKNISFNLPSVESALFAEIFAEIFTGTTINVTQLYRLSADENTVLVALPAHTTVTLLAGPRSIQGQYWWNVDTQLGQHTTQGWLAEKEIEFYMNQPEQRPFAIQDSPSNAIVQSLISHNSVPQMNTFQVGDVIYTSEVIRLYNTIGSTVALEEGTISYLWQGAQAQLINGPTILYDQTWWQVETRLENGHVQQGWTQETIPGGRTLFVKLGAYQPDLQYRPFGHPIKNSPGDAAFSQPLEQDVTHWRSGLLVIPKQPAPLYRTAVTQHIDEALPKVMGILAPEMPARVLMKPRKVGEQNWICLKGKNSAEETVHGWTPLLNEDGTPLFEVAENISDKSVENPTGGMVDKSTVTPAMVDILGIGSAIVTKTHVRMRHTPSYLNQVQDNFMTELPSQHGAKIIGGPEMADGLRWWQVETHSFSGNTLTGWVAERSPDGQLLLEQIKTDASGSVIQARRHQQDRQEERLSVDVVKKTRYAPQQILISTVYLRVRLTPGYRYKTSNDIVGEFRPHTTVNVIEGPLQADDLSWYRVGGITMYGNDVVGWVSAYGLDEEPYISTAPKLPGEDIPNRYRSGGYLKKPFIGRFGISQLWGENVATYAQFAYDGVPLEGHNGVDFMTYVGTPIVAVDAGIVEKSEFGFGGFGHFVLLSHSWGESVYAHLDQRYVAKGDSVKAGARLGLSGNTGRSTGPHLHFAIRINPYQRTDGWGGFSDPLPYLHPSHLILPGYVLPFTRGLADSDADVRVTEHLPPSTMSVEEPERGRP